MASLVVAMIALSRAAKTTRWAKSAIAAGLRSPTGWQCACPREGVPRSPPWHNEREYRTAARWASPWPAVAARLSSFKTAVSIRPSLSSAEGFKRSGYVPDAAAPFRLSIATLVFPSHTETPSCQAPGRTKISHATQRDALCDGGEPASTWSAAGPNSSVAPVEVVVDPVTVLEVEAKSLCFDIERTLAAPPSPSPVTGFLSVSPVA
jgi:hypothetical protein